MGKLATLKRMVTITVLTFLLVVGTSGCAEQGASNTQQATTTAAAQSFDNARVSYLGPEGTYTEEAAQCFFGDAADLSPKTTVPEAIAAVTQGQADYAVIPQENTIGGAVTNYVDALMAEKDVYVVGEIILPINQTLMAVSGATLDDIKLVCSHAQGLAQSEQWRETNLPDAEVQEMASTAAAACYVAETGNKSIAAVAAPGAARLYGLSVLAENVQISDANKTRFYVLSATRTDDQDATHAALIAECEANKLDDLIIQLHDAGLELTTVHDRPEGSYLGSYRYLIEVERAEGITAALRTKLEEIPNVRYLGSFDVLE